MTNFADRLATFSATLQFPDLPAEVVHDLKMKVLDGIGVGVAAATHSPQAVAVTDLAARWHGFGDCLVFCDRRGFAPAAAAFANAALIHAEDFDDTHPETLAHPTACILPTALALGQCHGLRGQEVLTLLAIGYETAVRVGLAACPGAAMHGRGFHTTALSGAVAAAAMSARAAGADRSVTMQAVRLSAGVAAGLLEATRDGSDGKLMQVGWATQAGMWAFAAAASGIAGSSQAFEGRLGLFRAHGVDHEVNVDTVLADLGRHWEFLGTEIKLYPACHHLQGFVDAAVDIHRTASVSSASDILNVRADLSPEQIQMVCEPVDVRVSPSSVYASKFSLQFTVAVALLRGSLDRDVVERALSDPDAQDLARRVAYQSVENTDFPGKLPGRLTVELVGGSLYDCSFTSTPGPRGRRISEEDVLAKFISNVDAKFPDEAAQQLIQAVLVLDAPTAADALWGSLRTFV